LQIGVALPQTMLEAGSAHRLARFAARAEQLGIDSLWVQEDTIGPNGTADPLPVLAIAASSTVRVELGVAVLILPMHRTAALAKTTATIDHLSAGRLIVGVGAGGASLPYELLGGDRRHRGAQVEQAIVELRRLWASGDITPAPPGPGRPPLWIGGHSAPALRRAAALADGFIGGGAASTVAFGRQVERLRVELAAHDRREAEFPIAKRVYLAIGSEGSRSRLHDWLRWYYGSDELARSVAVAGGPDECIAGLAAVVRAGARHLVLNFVFDEEQQLELAAASILTRRRELADEIR